MSKEDHSSKPVYGFVLTLRALAAFACYHPEYPASLRVLVVLAEYMNMEGVCRVSRFTLADRLGISRQAVQRHLALLKECAFLEYESDSGRITTFRLAADEFRSERAGADVVEDRRESRRRARRAAQRTHRPGTDATLDVAPPATSDVAPAAPLDVAPAATSLGCTKKPLGNLGREFPREPALRAVVSSGAGAALQADELHTDDKVRHRLFGEGVVQSVDSGGAWIAFASHGLRRVVPSFLVRAG
jgi:DNA-binding transcriptional ArsR family regulator